MNEGSVNSASNCWQLSAKNVKSVVVAEQALSNAKKVREEGALAVDAALQRLGALECEAATVLEKSCGWLES